MAVTAIGAAAKCKVSIEPIIQLKNGRSFSTGAVSNTPLLHYFEQWLQDRRIGDFREARGLCRTRSEKELAGLEVAQPLVLPKNKLHRWWVIRRIAKNRKKLGD